MITATLFRAGGEYTGFRASGHSGYADEGSDIVCAAVSVLGVTCVNAMEKLLGVIPVIRENESGLLAFDLPEIPEGERRRGAQLLMGAMEQGLNDVRDAYPEYLKVQTKGRGPGSPAAATGAEGGRNRHPGS